MNVVLLEPEIPQNAGNISRTCVLTNSELHLIKPLGFSLQDRYLKRAGLDYWQELSLTVHQSWESFLEQQKNQPGRFLFFSTQGKRYYTEVQYQENDFLIFGSETTGLPANLLLYYYHRVYRVPMVEHIKRSLNLGNTVAVVLYEALRQQKFPDLS